MKHNPASAREEAFPVLVLYDDEAQSSQHPRRGIFSTKVVLELSTARRTPTWRHRAGWPARAGCPPEPEPTEPLVTPQNLIGPK